MKTVKLGEVVLFNPQETIKKDTQSKKVSMDMIKPFCRDIQDFEIAEFKGGTKFRNGDTLMARITPCLENGKTVKVNILKDNEIGFGSTEYIVFRSIEEITDADFLYYLVCSPIIRNPAIKSMVGSSGRQRVQTDVLKNLEINIPDLENQRKIGSLLKSIDDKIELNNRINKNLEEQAQAIFKKYISDTKEKVLFTSIVKIFGGGTPETKNQDYWNGIIPFFTPKDSGNPYVIKTEKTITQSGLNNCNSQLYPINTVFLTARGTVGKISLAGIPMSMNQSCYALIGKNGLNQIIVYHYALEIVQSLKNKANGAVFDAITTRDFNMERVPILSAEQIDIFLILVTPIYNDILNRTMENKRLSALRDALLPKLINGEINVSEIKI